MADIRALGHLPRYRHEKSLAHRLKHAKRKRLLSESQLAELAETPVPESSVRKRAAERTDTLIDDIRALGRLPRLTQGLGDEYVLAYRLQWASRNVRLSASHLAELAEIAQSSMESI